MFYNKKKCHHLHIGKNTPAANSDEGNIKIDKEEYEKDLGVSVDKHLNFRKHITLKVNMANRNLGILFRTFTYMDRDVP